jgi:hypothetical protein
LATNHTQDRALLAGLSNARKSFQKLIEWFSGGVSTGPAGSVTKVQLGTNLTGTQVGDTLTIDAAGGGGGGGVQTINGISPDGGGEFGIASADGSVTVTGGTNAIDLSVPAGSGRKQIQFGVDNGTLAVTGSRSLSGAINYSGTIVGWTILGDIAGDATFIVQRATYANYDTMTTLFSASVSGAIKAQGTVSHAVLAGDTIRIEGNTFANFRNVTITLDVELT